MTPEQLTAIGGLVIAILAWVTNRQTARLSIRRDELTLVRDELVRLHETTKENESRLSKLEREKRILQLDLSTVREYSLKLRLMLMALGRIDIPEMPKLRSDDMDSEEDDKEKEDGNSDPGGSN